MSSALTIGSAADTVSPSCNIELQTSPWHSDLQLESLVSAGATMQFVMHCSYTFRQRLAELPGSSGPVQPSHWGRAATGCSPEGAKEVVRICAGVDDGKLTGIVECDNPAGLAAGDAAAYGDVAAAELGDTAEAIGGSAGTASGFATHGSDISNRIRPGHESRHCRLGALESISANANEYDP